MTTLQSLQEKNTGPAKKQPNSDAEYSKLACKAGSLSMTLGFYSTNPQNFVHAIHFYKQAIKTDNNPDAHLGRAEANFFLGNIKAAKKGYKKAKELDPTIELKDPLFEGVLY